MPKASEIKRGVAVELNGKLLIVRDISVSSPSARGAATLYKMRFADVRSGQKVEETFKGDEIVMLAELERRASNFLYMDGDNYVFMDAEDYSQYIFAPEAINEERLFITDDTQGILVLINDGQAITVALPQSVEMTISDTTPSIKGASATARTKPAKFATGLIVQVPEYIAPGERVKIHVAEKRFMGRAENQG